MQILSDKRFQRECDGRFEKVSVGRKGNRSVLQFQQTFRNGKPETASFRVSGKIASDETLQQLVTGNTERRRGNVFENDDAIRMSLGDNEVPEIGGGDEGGIFG